MARTHYRGIIRKRLIPMKFTNENGEGIIMYFLFCNEIVSLDLE